MKILHNPILPGFNPDPCVIRVGRDYYLATSTFEWWPAVMIYHSRDLAHWNLAARPVDRIEQLDLRGTQGSRGVWAPALSYDGELFHLCYTHGKGLNAHVLDQTNYLITAPDIRGPWSDRIYMNETGFDPSMFHDEDGKKYHLNMMLDPESEHRFAGIVLQEYSPVEKRLVGEETIIFPGTDLQFTEGPHLYRKDGWYYLVCAEGGSNWKHAVTVARSRNIRGPYEVHPENPILTSAGDPENPLQKSGHGSIVSTPGGEWYLAHLCSRPNETRHSILGRESSMQKLVWPKGEWPRLETDGRFPQLDVPTPQDGEALPSDKVEDIRFAPGELYPYLMTLREPADSSWLSLEERPGWLRLYGRHSLYCDYQQSLVAHRMESHHGSAETTLEFEPQHFRQSAGLAAFYDDNGWMAALVGKDRVSKQKVLRQIVSQDESFAYPVDPVLLNEGPVELRIEVRDPEVQFLYRQDGDWLPLGGPQSSHILADEFGKRMRFTGAFFALCAQDATNNKVPADFQRLTLRKLRKM